MTPEEFDRKRAIDGAAIMRAIQRIQTNHPQLRFGQIVANAMAPFSGGCRAPDLFYIENSVMLEAIHDFEKKLDKDAKK